ncbi:MAG: ankyrin repeat domain-containing protein, partial [Verrucomicrobia bacterium]|nr:ankyrin repeat domain-containing protein [Verrucomicrobiota bacterium]
GATATKLLDEQELKDVLGLALIIAAKNGHKIIVEKLIPLANLQITDSDGKTAYDHAAALANTLSERNGSLMNAIEIKIQLERYGPAKK